MKLIPILATTLAMLAATVGQSQSTRPYVPGHSLVAWYPFTGNAIDSSGNGNNGSMSGCTLTADRFGTPNSAYYFNGRSSYVLVPASSSLDLPKELSIAAWIKTDNYTGSDAQIFWRGDSRSASDPYMLFVTSSTVSFRRDCGSGYTTYQTGFAASTIDTSRFHLVVGTYSPVDDSMKLYFDGQQIASVWAGTRLTYSTAGFWNVIGAVDRGSWQFFKGIIDDVGAWNRRLYPCEILKMYLARTNLILSGPVNDTSYSSGSASFYIHDTGSLGYTWQIDTGTGFYNVPAVAPFIGVNNDSLQLSSVNDSLCGSRFRCIIGSGNCMDTSAVATLYCWPPRTTLVATLAAETPEAHIIPNPNNGQFHLHCKGLIGLPTIQIYNALGACVYRSAAVNNGGDTFELDPNLSPGTYLLRLSAANYCTVLPFVKEH